MKTKMVVICIIVSLVFSGCSSIGLDNSELVKKHLLEGNTQYDEYLSMKSIREKENEIDANGYYSSDKFIDTETDSNDGPVHVSFASDKLLNIFYYYDSEHKELIDKDHCYMFPGDKIYAKVDFTSRIQSNTYEFRGFQMAVFDGENSNYNYSSFDGEEITIPLDLTYSEISIIPVGDYKKRELSFSAEYIDDEGNSLSLSPIWEIDIGEQSYPTKANSYSIEASSSFRVKVKYDPHEYYFNEEKSKTKCESFSDKEGIILFPSYDAHNAVDKYEIVFGKKFPVRIESVSASGPVTIWIDKDKYDLSVSDFPFEGYAKLGDMVKIESLGGNIYNVGSVKNLHRLSQVGFSYSVWNEESSIEFDPLSFIYENGKVTFYDSEHNVITTKTELNIGDIIFYKGEAADGYTFNMPEGDNKIIVDSNIDYMLRNELKFYPKQKIILSQPSVGGSIIYFLNGKEIKDETITFSPDSDSLTANFKAAERYKPNNISDQAECIISSGDHRIRFVDNSGNKIGLENVFVLSSEQKANLTVELDDSVGTETKFFIYNGKELANTGKHSYVPKDMFDSFSNPLGLDDNELLKNYKMDTISGIKVNVSDWSPLTGEAIRIDVTKTNSSKNKSNETYYILSGSGSQYINTNSGGSTYYTDIEIEISKVKGSKFYNNEYTYENANLEFIFNDTTSDSQIRNGDYVDNERKIRVIVTAKEGYQLFEKSINPFSSSYNSINSYEIKCEYADLSDEFSKMKKKTKVSY